MIRKRSLVSVVDDNESVRESLPDLLRYSGFDVHAFASAEALEDWLEREHATSDGIWLKFAKKGSGIASVTYAEAVEVGLCYGWIDSHTLSLDERFYLQKLTPRRARSKWSRINRDKVEELTRQGRIRPAGLAEVDRAKQDAGQG